MTFFTPHLTSGSAGSVAAASAQSAASSAKAEVGLLKFEIERLLMIAEALWSILKEKYHYEDEELIGRINEIDMRDGRLDGRVTSTGEPMACPECGRTLSKRRPICLYCGTAVVLGPFER